MSTVPPSAAALVALRAAAGPGAASDDPADLAPHLSDWRGQLRGRAALLLRPRDAAAVAAIVRAAAAHRVALVPQGGNTGLVGGGIPDGTGDAVIVSTVRLNRILAVDAAALTLTAEAGVTLQAVHEAAAAAGCRFPLSLAAKGTATIGGLVATNAGGTQVLRHGTMRALVAGLAAVLPDGTTLDSLSGLAKDNTGYDLKQLLIGGEGTLGIVTAATLRLVPATAEVAVAWAGTASPAQALALLARLRTAGFGVESCELIPAAGLALVLAHFPGPPPLAGEHPWHLLIEVAGGEAGLADRLAAGLGEALEAGEIDDATVAASAAQAAALWALRETLPEAERRDGFTLKHDIAVPVARLPGFVAAVGPEIEAGWPGARLFAFGHLGDGNLHFNVRPPAGADAAAWVAANGPAIARHVHDRVTGAGGSISAEHGIGTVKRAELARLAEPAKLAAMRAIKAALDPLGIMNPGKLL